MLKLLELDTKNVDIIRFSSVQNRTVSLYAVFVGNLFANITTL